MLFNSLTFVVFFVVVVTLYWSIKSWQARKNLLVVASYIFYGAWNPPFAALLFGTTAMDFWLGRQMGKSQRSTCKTSLAGRERLHESEHARFFQIRNLSAPKFSVIASACGDHLSTAASEHTASGRNFFLHFPFTFLHARYLSGRPATDEVFA